jgi:hypothetical protein
MGGLSNVHMPSSARDDALAINKPPESRTAKERKDVGLLMLFELLICRLDAERQNGGFLSYPKFVIRSAKRSLRPKASSP